MHRYMIQIAIFVMVFIISGCPYESKVPLSVPDSAKLDPDFTGTWIYTDGERKKDHVIPIIAFNDHEYLIVLNDEKETDYVRAFTTEIAGRRFLNYQELKMDGTRAMYGFLKYEIRNDTLYLYTVEDYLIQEAFERPTDLFNHIRKHVDDERLYAPFEVFKRSKTEVTPGE